jgi:arylsulfatase A-like enzyme
MHHDKLSHDDMNLIELVDDELVKHLQNMERKGHLNNTLIIIMSDHGPRFHKTRETHQVVITFYEYMKKIVSMQLSIQ